MSADDIVEPLIRLAPSEEDPEDGPDAELEEDEDEFENPDPDDAYEEMRERTDDRWVEAGEGEPSPLADDSVLDFLLER